MIFYPAIDLKDGHCVRLLRGEMDKATVFNDDAGAQARIFRDAGCEWIHVVDLNGAFAGRPLNAGAVAAILEAVDLPIELGGGIRNAETIDDWLEAGVKRVILGTAALRDPALVKDACKRHPGGIAVGIDAHDGYVAVEGWAEVSEVTVLEMAKRFEDAGVAAIIHTDISRDGAMTGPNLDATVDLARETSIPVILSGGVSSFEDLERIKAVGGDLLEGVISGRAVYDGHVDPAKAVTFLKS